MRINPKLLNISRKFKLLLSLKPNKQKSLVSVSFERALAMNSYSRLDKYPNLSLQTSIPHRIFSF